jgi:hypothetical protein
MSKTVVLLLGPSGVDKTTMGEALQQKLDLLHILLDGHPEGDGVDVANLRSEWDTLLNTRNLHPLVHEVWKRIEASGHTEPVISRPRGILLAEDGQGMPWHFPRSLLMTMGSIGLRCAVLAGPLDLCMKSAINRPGSGVTVASSCLNNPDWPGIQPSRDALPRPVTERRCHCGALDARWGPDSQRTAAAHIP